MKKYHSFFWLWMIMTAMVAGPAAAGGDLQVVGPPGTQVWLSGQLQGKLGAAGLYIEDLEGGEYNFKAKNRGKILTGNVAIKNGRTLEVVLDFDESTTVEDINRKVLLLISRGDSGDLVLRSLPLHARISLDGKEIGRGDKQVHNLGPGEHTVRFVLGDQVLEKAITVAARETWVVKADFRREQIVVERTDSGHGLEMIVIQNLSARQPTLFPHQKHQQFLECKECHHGMDENGKQLPYEPEMRILACVSCHNSEMGNKSLNSLKLAGHSLCKGCHRKMADQGRIGPIARCIGCHFRPGRKTAE
ncbi:MAG: PEGA domain-containing protein [Desulfobacterales bacterium]|nr:PEGA domain-containing protein [Desulfobacterales bacterium]